MDINQKVKKPVEAIQCANTFSLLQRKMYNVLLANAAGNLYPDVTHRITMRVLCKLMGYRSNDYQTIKAKFRELRRMDIEWDIINEKGNKVWTNTSPLSLARVIEGEGICEYEFTPSLVPFLDRPAQYAKFSLAIQAKFKSSYGLALYENCERYRNIGCTKTFDIPTFRRLMGINPGEYQEFFALKRRVIAIALKEVNQFADFSVEIEYEKKGRIICAVKFILINKNKEHCVQEDIPDKIIPLTCDITYKLKSYFGVKEKDAAKYFNQYGQLYVEEKVNDILNSESFNLGLIKNMGGYLKAALKEDFSAQLSGKIAAEKHRKTREKIQNNKRQMEDSLKILERKYEYYLAEALCKIINTCTEKRRVKILLEFTNFLGSGCYRNIFHKEGLKNVLIADQLVKFIRAKHPSFLKKIMSFDNFLKKMTA